MSYEHSVSFMIVVSINNKYTYEKAYNYNFSFCRI